MSRLTQKEGTLVVVATGEGAKTFRVKGGALQHDGNWATGDLADQGPSGKTPPDMSDRDLNEADLLQDDRRAPFIRWPTPGNSIT